MGSEKHRDLTGKDIGPTLDFARRLAARKRPIWVRFVLVPGLTDDAEDIAQIAKFLPAWEMSSVSRCCPFIRWVDSNGRNSESTTRLTMLSLRPAPWPSGLAACFGLKDSRQTEYDQAQRYHRSYLYRQRLLAGLIFL